MFQKVFLVLFKKKSYLCAVKSWSVIPLDEERFPHKNVYFIIYRR